jgi:hypothetical protein
VATPGCKELNKPRVTGLDLPLRLIEYKLIKVRGVKHNSSSVGLVRSKHEAGKQSNREYLFNHLLK